VYRQYCGPGQVYPKDLRALPGHPEPAVSWHSGFLDERIDPIPVRIAAMKNIGLRDGDGYIAVRVRWTVMFEMERGAIQGERHL
jgi:hypothetical protein